MHIRPLMYLAVSVSLAILIVACVSNEASEQIQEQDKVPAVLQETCIHSAASEGNATLTIDIRSHYTSKLVLQPVCDCFHIVWKRIVNSGSGGLLILLGMLTSNPVDPPEVYRYFVYNEICIDVEEDHQYQVRLRSEQRRRRDDFFQIWDLTIDRRLLEINRNVLGFEQEDLELRPF